MSDEFPEAMAPARDIDKLTNQLERTARKINDNKREHFVDSRNLCSTCKWATITRQASANNRVIFCTSLSMKVPDDIMECNEYANITQLSLGQMAEMATLIGGIKERKAGFIVKGGK